MRFSLNHAFLVFALAIGSVEPVDATITKNEPPLRHSLFKRAADGFHKTALRHSSGLARDLRLAFRGLSDPGRVAVFRSSNKAYCVSNKGLGTSNGTGSNENHSTATPTSTGNGSPTASASSTQLNWQLAQSYVRSLFWPSVPAGAKNFTPTYFCGLQFLFRSREALFSPVGTSLPEVIQLMGSCSTSTSRPRCVLFGLFSTPLGRSDDCPCPLFSAS
jgi:hypothetical protein